MNTILDTIKSPDDLKTLPESQLITLADDIRQQLIETVSEFGGHIGPNLGVVELTIALLKVFSPPTDKIIWDVGHQSYVYKMLTGRLEAFKTTLRQDDGFSGFPSRDESEYDCFGTGHAGTAISAALGMAVARDLLGKSEKLIAVVGDGALGCGVSLEALNHIAEVTRDFVLVVNDNEMSIGDNVGAIAKNLNRIIIAPSAKATINRGSRKIDDSGTEQRVDSASFFEHLGVRYIGPVDGHDITELLTVFGEVIKNPGPVVVHVITEKGRGFEPAKKDPELFHGLGKFDPKTGQVNASNRSSFTSTFGKEICKIAEENSKVVAITAGMCKGTGLSDFRDKFPKRLFDVGIAEEHAVIYAAGMATNGIKPLVALYGTFSQRAFDCVYHDVCLQSLPVVFTMDRAGIVPDGPTHHGIYDLSFWQAIPNVSILQPASEWEVGEMLKAAFDKNAPVVIRYPKANCPKLDSDCLNIEWGKAAVVSEFGNDATIWASGGEVATALEVQKLLANEGIQTIVVNARFLRPFDEEFFIKQLNEMPLFTIEDHVAEGGLASISNRIRATQKTDSLCINFCWPNSPIPGGTVKGIRRKFGMAAEQIAQKIINSLRN